MVAVSIVLRLVMCSYGLHRFHSETVVILDLINGIVLLLPIAGSYMDQPAGPAHLENPPRTSIHVSAGTMHIHMYTYRYTRRDIYTSCCMQLLWTMCCSIWPAERHASCSDWPTHCTTTVLPCACTRAMQADRASSNHAGAANQSRRNEQQPNRPQSVEFNGAPIYCVISTSVPDQSTSREAICIDHLHKEAITSIRHGETQNARGTAQATVGFLFDPVDYRRPCELVDVGVYMFIWAWRDTFGRSTRLTRYARNRV
jgi:hypothetical protein